MIYTAILTSPLGALTLATDGEGIQGLWMEGQAHFCRGLPDATQDGRHLDIVLTTADWLDAYFAGKNPSPSLLALTPTGTDFQKAVWNQLQRIPYGHTVTYGYLARCIATESGRAASPRAVGSAVGRNPISILIPCHRVIGTDGRLTGYAGGVPRKAFLLELENGKIPVDMNGVSK